MITCLRHELQEKLIELGNLYPAMRFGQLVCFACALAGEDVPGTVEDVCDEAVLLAVKGHIATRSQEIGSNANGNLAGKDLVRSRLMKKLEDLGSQYPEWSVGGLISKLAALAHLNVYDAEDEQLLQAANSSDPGLEWFKRYTDELECRSIVGERRDEQSYRCPCCHYRTLYERGGFEICPVCYWEDDGQDDEDADTARGGPNGSLSLAQARENYSQYEVCDLKFAEHVRPPRPSEK